MDLYNPTLAHAATDPGGYCAAHDGLGFEEAKGLTSVAFYGQPRIWRIGGDSAIAVSAPSGPSGRLERVRELLLTPGTHLRLDSLDVRFYCDGMTHQVTTRRFCVLDGRLAGRCCRAWDTLLDDHKTHLADPVEPLATRP